MLSGFFPYHLFLATNNRTTIENMERNGRLLSLPAKAESALSAGTLEPRTAGLPERPKGGAPHLLPITPTRDQYVPSRGADIPNLSRNAFLPHDSQSQFSTPPPTSFEASASHSLSRLQRSQLERKAGQINIYDLGTASRNFVEAFGGTWYDPKSWLPVGRSRGTGYEYPVNKGNLKRLRRLNEELKGAGHSGY